MRGIGRLRYLSPRFALALCRNLLLKLRYGASLDMDLFGTYLSAGTVVAISGRGRIVFQRGSRVFVGRGCELRASGGTLVVGPGVFFNRGCSVVSHESVRIGEDCMFGPGVCVYDSDHRLERIDRPFRVQGYQRSAVTIGRNVWIGANSVVTKGTDIGDSAVVGACSLVRGKLEGAAVYAGNPVRFRHAIGPGAARVGAAGEPTPAADVAYS